MSVPGRKGKNLIPPVREIDLGYDRVRIRDEVVKSQVWTTFDEWWDLVFAVELLLAFVYVVCLCYVCL